MVELKQQGHAWGLRIGTEIVASTMVGLGLGFFLDNWLGTRPLMLILFAIFGLLAGFVTLHQAMVITPDKQKADRL